MAPLDWKTIGKSGFALPEAQSVGKGREKGAIENG
jgi:hypothetical protein